MPKSPVFNYGEHVIVTNPVDDHYLNKTGMVIEDEYRSYISDYVYVVKMDDGYEMEFWTQVKVSVYGLVTFLLFMSLFAN